MRAIFERVWKSLEYIYNNGAICSERHMQAELFRLLMNDDEFSDSYRIFVEPRLYGLKNNTSLNGKIPDFIIVLKKDKVIAGVLEMKYVPHHYPQFEKDISTLANFVDIGEEEGIVLETNVADGNWSGEKFTFSESTSLIFCVIGKSDSYAITDNVWKYDGKAKGERFNYMQFVGAVGNVGNNGWKIHER